MKDQVVIGPNGDLGVAIPLFRINESEPLANLDGYSMYISTDKPVGYILDAGHEGTCPFVNAKLVESKCIFLGDL